MNTHFLITSSTFTATPGELDESHEDFINPGIYALELADFLDDELSKRGYPIRFRCQEDWGHWLELEHAERYTLAVGCSNAGEGLEGRAEHRIFLVPNKPIIRKFFKKLDVRQDLERLSATIEVMLNESPIIEDIRTETVA